MWVQYLPRQFCTHFIHNSYSVFIINNSGFLTVDCSREKTAIGTFFVISSNINKVTIQPAAGYLVNCRLYTNYS